MAVSSTREHQDVLLTAPTGFGKTLVSAMLQMTKRGDEATVILFLLNRLQSSASEDIFNDYGLECAVVNRDSPWNRAWWDEHIHNLKTRQSGSAKVILATPEQFFKQRAGQTYARFGELMKEKQFTRRICLVVVDEGHYVSTAGISHYGLPTFRSAYGNLRTIQIRLADTPWLVQTATVTKRFLYDLESQILRKPYLHLKMSTNRPDIVYANPYRQEDN
ncbi:atp-dependent dna helicase [Moniliophthora roreri MCA 2997]|uniref:DNA 3'-5' helicase n=1 Tax=Moniliophthora roreri (strain MCA 2997) TaxID=1381753 RepID=V2X9L2_MONRO|nr:atp-dependent dna helicase [Moniliophthora roreri MCA 2997]